ncbi:hypothetical protein EDB80DRAFT_708694 [Ilyonectria destructans]|nr:hypothetical protein EDB80DRAFT_708694 [Ilyonectria destructans]
MYRLHLNRPLLEKPLMLTIFFLAPSLLRMGIHASVFRGLESPPQKATPRLVFKELDRGTPSWPGFLKSVEQLIARVH